MRIKHFAGYGCVNAKKLKHETKNGITTLIINISGDHERGLRPYIIEDAIQWLAARYDKNIVNIPWYNICIDINNNYDMPCDTLTYTFKYKKGLLNMAALFILLIIVCYGKYIFLALAILSILYGLYLTS